MKALCRYCLPFKEPGLVPCPTCEGWRNPSRRQARRLFRKANDRKVKT